MSSNDHEAKTQRLQAIYTAYLPRIYGYVAARVDTWLFTIARHTLIYNAAFHERFGEWQLEIKELIGFGNSGADAQQTRISGAWVFDFTIAAE